MHLQHAPRRRVGQHAAPAIGAERLGGPGQFERVRAIGALQRATICQLRQQGERWAWVGHGIGHATTTPLSARSCSISRTSRPTVSRGASNLAESRSAMAATVVAPSQSRRISTAISSGTKNRRSEEHTSELQSLMRISYAGFCLKKKK